MLGVSQRVITCAGITFRRYTTVVDKNVLSKLRKKTGFPLINCKKALEKFENQFKEAENWLKEQAQKEGWNKATKLQDRPMSQGLVGIFRDDSSATVIEVNCETDFVARNSQFQSLVVKLAQTCHQRFNETGDTKVMLEKEALSSSQVVDSEGRSLADNVATLVGNLGENMVVRRAGFLKASGSEMLGTYVHAAGQRLELDGCLLGKFGSVVKIQKAEPRIMPSQEEEIKSNLPLNENNNKSASPSEEAGESGLPSEEEEEKDEFCDLPLEVVAQQLCHHVTGMNPQSIGQPEDQQPEKKKKKKSNEEETALLLQEFLLMPRKNVQKYLEDNAAEVLDFMRLECGEELDED